jgi:non-ribosomal peptide synthetase component F
LARLGRAESATYFVVRLAGFVALVATELNRQDLLVGTYVSNRSRLPLQSIGGLFVNLVALRFFYRPEQSFRQWLAIVRRVMMEAEARSAIPFDVLCDELERSGGGRPPIEMIFQHSQIRHYMEFADLKITRLEPLRESMPWGFSMTVNEYAEQHSCTASFDAYRYDPAEVRAFIERYKRLLDAVSREPDRALGELAPTRPAQ